MTLTTSPAKLNKWIHPTTGQVRFYLNSPETLADANRNEERICGDIAYSRREVDERYRAICGTQFWCDESGKWFWRGSVRREDALYIIARAKGEPVE